ncbi:MAG: hypothetical protein AAGA18_09405 [Verrucomicrobiota bacterium]
MLSRPIIAVVCPMILVSCASTIETAQNQQVYLNNQPLLLIPFTNATHDENAGIAITELLHSQLRKYGISVQRLEQPNDQQQFLAITQKTESEYLKIAQEMKIPYLLLGTVIEYRYKVDLDADPAVAITVHILDSQTGQTVWNGTANNTGVGFSSLGSVSQELIRDFTERMPIE